MPHSIIHGDNLIQSRQALFTVLEQLHASNTAISRFEAKELDVVTIERLLGTQDFFEDTTALVIDGLHSLPISAKRKQLISLLSSPQNPQQSIILWEKKKLTPSQLKAFSSFKSQEFKASSALFTWLDAIHLSQPTKTIPLLRKALDSDGVEFCLSMLQRQIRQIITIKFNGQLKSAPFMIQKLERQAQAFSEKQLLELHEKLTFLDYRWKTGQEKQSLQQVLEQLMLQSHV